MLLQLTMRPDDGDQIVINVDSRDALVWERTNRRGRTASDLAVGVSIEDQYDLGFIAGRRTGKLAADLDRKIFDTCWVVTETETLSDEDPTQPTA